MYLYLQMIYAYVCDALEMNEVQRGVLSTHLDLFKFIVK